MAILNYNPPMVPYLEIIHQDEDILVLNKPSGLLSVPGKAKEHADCLQSRAQRVFTTATSSPSIRHGHVWLGGDGLK